MSQGGPDIGTWEELGSILPLILPDSGRSSQTRGVKHVPASVLAVSRYPSGSPFELHCPEGVMAVSSLWFSQDSLSDTQCFRSHQHPD